MTAEWKELTVDEKKQYDAMSQREKDRYENQMKEYRKKQAASGEGGDKLVGKKRPPTASPAKVTPK